MCLIYFLLTFITNIFACDISWERLDQKTPLHTQNLRPQGLSRVGDYLFLANHYKDSNKGTLEPSDLFKIDLKNFSVIKKYKFPPKYKHVGGLASADGNLYGIDFDEQDFFKISTKENSEILDVETLFQIPQKGLSGLAMFNNIVAVSNYIIPYEKPYFSGRLIRFFDLHTGKEIMFKGEMKSSNYSQGLTFIKYSGSLFLLESINKFKSVLKYWISGLDSEHDIVRVYKVDITKKIIEFVKDIKSPSVMIEDLGNFDNEVILTSDEQSFSFYKGRLSNCL